jgi:hypothetical protein
MTQIYGEGFSGFSQYVSKSACRAVEVIWFSDKPKGPFPRKGAARQGLLLNEEGIVIDVRAGAWQVYNNSTSINVCPCQETSTVVKTIFCGGGPGRMCRAMP